MHGSDYDLRLLWELCRFEPQSLFDTMFAAQLAEHPPLRAGRAARAELRREARQGPPEGQLVPAAARRATCSTTRPWTCTTCPRSATGCAPACRSAAGWNGWSRSAASRSRRATALPRRTRTTGGSTAPRSSTAAASPCCTPSGTGARVGGEDQHAAVQGHGQRPAGAHGAHRRHRRHAGGDPARQPGRRHDRLFPSLAEAVRQGLATDPHTPPRRGGGGTSRR